MTPYPYPCSATSPTTRNQNHAGEPPRNLVVGRFSDPCQFAPSPVRPPVAIGTLPLSDAWALRSRRPPTPSPLPVGRLGPFTATPRARVGPKSPPPRAQLTENPFSLFLFPFSFPIFHIYYILIFYAPKIAQIFYVTQNNNI
jgi:hypothetical protein